jgi:uncharacterized membrane protein YfcA
MLGLFLNDTLTRLNTLKQYITLCVNVAAAVFFLFSGMIVWSVAAVMAVGALIGGVAGRHLAGCIIPDLLRWTVVIIGIIIGIIFLVRL